MGRCEVKMPSEFTMQQAINDFMYGARMYLKSDRDSATILVRVRTERPLMWFIFADAGGTIHPGYWECAGMTILHRVVSQLLESKLADEPTRAKLELLKAFCEAPREDRPMLAMELKRLQKEVDVEFKALGVGYRGKSQ